MLSSDAQEARSCTPSEGVFPKRITEPPGKVMAKFTWFAAGAGKGEAEAVREGSCNRVGETVSDCNGETVPDGDCGGEKGADGVGKGADGVGVADDCDCDGVPV